MFDKDKWLKQAILHEGNKPKLYPDIEGKMTIGIGHNLTDNGLSSKAIEFIFDEDTDRAWDDLISNHRMVLQFDEIRQRVLLDMCFNMGINKLNGFKNMWRALWDGQFNIAASEMLDSVWARQVGLRAIRLARMMRTGQDYENSVIREE